MTDKELLELAAKAAGIEVNIIQYCDGRFDNRLTTQYETCSVTRDWNPLTDDGDALRLAVKLNLDIHFEPEPDGPIVVVCPDYDIDFEWPYIFENLEGDTKAPSAVRLAIVRAAAELGRGKP
jgi:hypothetical protein